MVATVMGHFPWVCPARARLRWTPKAVRKGVQVGFAEGRDVERSRVVRLERVPQEDGEEERADDAVGDVVGVDRAELPGLHPAAEDRPEERQGPVDDLVEV